MLKEFIRYNNLNKIYQKLFNDEEFQLYVAYQDTATCTKPKNIMIEYNLRKSSDGGFAIMASAEGYWLAQTDKYLFSSSLDGYQIEHLKALIIDRSQYLPEHLVNFIRLSLSKPCNHSLVDPIL